LLQNLVFKCAKADGIRDFFHVGLLSCGGRVASAFSGALAGQGLVPAAAETVRAMATPALSDTPQQGQLVSVRSRQRVVNGARPGTLACAALKPIFHGPQQLLTHSSVEDAGLGEQLHAIREIGPGARLVEKIARPDPTGSDPPDQLDASLDAVRWGAASTADVKNIQVPLGSGLDTEDDSPRLSALEEAPPELRAVRVVTNEAAQGEKFVIPQNMRVPASSVIRSLFEADGERDAANHQDLGHWSDSKSKRLEGRAVAVEARRVADRVIAVVQPVEPVRRLQEQPPGPHDPHRPPGTKKSAPALSLAAVAAGVRNGWQGGDPLPREAQTTRRARGWRGVPWRWRPARWPTGLSHRAAGRAGADEAAAPEGEDVVRGVSYNGPRYEPPRTFAHEPGDRQSRREQATQNSRKHGLAYPVLRNLASG
jgi:hypothetical protein